jgi:hypothetical protein
MRCPGAVLIGSCSRNEAEQIFIEASGQHDYQQPEKIFARQTQMLNQSTVWRVRPSTRTSAARL